jgi:tRNA U38,U39,U40 pseudouridine synthase TruA
VAQRLPGRHDFRNFAEIDPGSTDSSTLVEVESVEVAEEGALVLVRIVASHFLWKMVRRLIGTLAQVGAGHLAAEDFDRLLEGAPPAADDPRPAQWTAPPSGLFLERVLYPGDPPLQPVAAVTRVLAAPALGGEATRSREAARSRPRQQRRAGGRADSPMPRRGRGRPG